MRIKLILIFYLNTYNNKSKILSFVYSAMTDKHSVQGDTTDDTINVLDHDMIPNFQRVSISGEDTSGVPLEDLERASTLLIQALEMRSRYMSISEQSFPTTTLRFLKTVHESDRFNKIQYEDRKSIAGKSKLQYDFLS